MSADLTLDGFLDGAVRAWQPKTGFRSASDAVLMAAAVPALRGDSVLELGCGAGVASLCLNHRTGASVLGVEVQSDYAALARKNGLEVVEADIADIPADLRQRSFHHVMFNPPYYGTGEGTVAEMPTRDLAMREKLPLEDWLDAAVRRLRPKGSVSAILRADRLPDLLRATDARLGKMRVLPLCPRAGRPAKRIIFQAVKGARAPFVLLPPLILHQRETHGEDGDDHTPKAADILRRGKALALD